MQQEKKVLFVCLGNICRSPMAEAILKKKVAELGKENEFFIDSCGISGQHVGELPDYRARKVLQKHRTNLTHHARKFSNLDLDKFDFIFAMDSQIMIEVLRSASPQQKNKVKLLMEYSNFFPGERNVYDPYYDNEEKFEEVYNLLAQCLSKFLETLKTAP